MKKLVLAFTSLILVIGLSLILFQNCSPLEVAKLDSSGFRYDPITTGTDPNREANNDPNGEDEPREEPITYNLLRQRDQQSDVLSIHSSSQTAFLRSIKWYINGNYVQTSDLLYVQDSEISHFENCSYTVKAIFTDNQVSQTIQTTFSSDICDTPTEPSNFASCDGSSGTSTNTIDWSSRKFSDLNIKQYLEFDKITSYTVKIDSSKAGGDVGASTILGNGQLAIRWKVSISPIDCRGAFKWSSDHPCYIDFGSRIHWVRSDLAHLHPDRCALEPNKEYSMNVRISTSQPNEYCTNVSGIEFGQNTGLDPGICDVIISGDNDNEDQL